MTFAGAGGLQLKGTLLKPAITPASARFPAVLLLPGSGPTDRDGNQPPRLVTNLLKQIAERLAEAGIATFRFDKRAAQTYADEWPKATAELNAFLSYENFVADATAAYHWLRGAEGIDPARVAILGHSEGGLFALQIARDLSGSGDRPAGLILAAAAGRVLDAVLREQIATKLQGQGRDQASRARMLEHLDRAIAAVKQEAPLPPDFPPGLTPVFERFPPNLLRSYFEVEPSQLAADVRGPVLVIQGRDDTQLSVERDARWLKAVLDQRKSRNGVTPSAELVIVDDASHNFKAPTGGPAGLEGFTGPVIPEALEAIADWCTRRL